MIDASPPPPRIIAPLTGLRFVAAMLVVLHHYPVPGVQGTAATVMQAGYFGVTLFFVLSGFVLAYAHLDTFGRPGGTGVTAFAVARFARIYPVYVLVLLYVWLRSGASGPIVSHALLLQAWHADAAHAFALNGPGWSLSVEAFLYACFPLIVVALRRGRVLESGGRMAVVLVAIVTMMVAASVFFDVTGRNIAGADPGSAHRWLYRSPVSRLGDFMLGVLAAAYLLRYRARVQARARAWSAIALLAAAVMLVCMSMPSNIDSTYSWDVLYALIGVGLIAGLAFAPAGPLGRALARPLPVLLGESSYCLYLLQVPVGQLRLPAAPLDLAGERLLHVLFIGLLVLLAVGLHRSVERPAQRAIRGAYAGWVARRTAQMTTSG
jgi:peptidoglycan/LPS O-acetylase OafA/YrhL